jgi:hypothetical protein
MNQDLPRPQSGQERIAALWYNNVSVPSRPQVSSPDVAFGSLVGAKSALLWRVSAVALLRSSLLLRR